MSQPFKDAAKDTHYGFTCSKCGEHDEMSGPDLDSVVKRMRRLFWLVKVRGTADRDASYVLCAFCHTQRIANFKQRRKERRAA